MIKTKGIFFSTFQLNNRSNSVPRKNKSTKFSHDDDSSSAEYSFLSKEKE
jgi:hypothetical protein